MARILTVLFIAAAMACSSDNNESKGTPIGLALKRASSFCNVSQNEMDWLLKLIVEIESQESDLSLHGPIYAFRASGQSIFIHQPWIMSCFGCILYDCEGNRIDPQDIDQSVLSAGFQNLTEIYSPVLE